MRLFADDTSLTASAKNIDELLLKINKELPNIYDWLCANKLTLNLRTTKYLILQPRQKVDYNLLPPVSGNKLCIFPLFLVSEQHNYFTRSASAQQLHIPHSQINI